MKQLEREQEIRRKRYQREEQKRMEVRRRAAEVRELKIEAIRRKAEAKSVKAIASTKTTSPRDSPVAKKSPVKVLKSAQVSVASKRSLKKVIKTGDNKENKLGNPSCLVVFLMRTWFKLNFRRSWKMSQSNKNLSEEKLY